MSVKPTYSLPQSKEQRQQLMKTITSKIIQLENDMNQNSQDVKLVKKNQEYIGVLKMRQKLIAKCSQLSLLRLNNLEEVFKHYCTHIYKTGKHMTFERLEYEKVHMTMDRFFLFLKDFDLTTATIQAKKREVLEKPSIILVFKKMSSNARELSFEEFIQCIERLAIMYWDEKNNYVKKQEENQIRMQNIKKMNQKRRKKKMGLKSEESSPEKSGEEENNQENSAQKEANARGQKNKKAVENVQPEANNNQNDFLVEELMKNGEIEDPNQQVRQVAQKAKLQNDVAETAKKMQVQQLQSLLQISSEEKIEYYYQMLSIDSVQNYKAKLTILNTPNYIVHHSKNEHQSGVKALSQSKLQAAQHEEERLQKLKAKMNEKKEKLKDRPLPKPNNEKALQQEQNSRRRRQMKKEREKAVKELKIEEVKKHEEKLKAPPKIEYKEGQVSWQMLEKLTIDQLKLKQFNLSKLYAPDEDDRYFLQEFGGKPRINERLQARERQSLSIVQSTKMRAQQLQKKQRQKSGQTGKKQLRQNTSVSRNRI